MAEKPESRSTSGDDADRAMRELDEAERALADDEDSRLAIPAALRAENQPKLETRATLGKPVGKPSGLLDMAKAWGTALEFIGTIAVGGGVGWLIDRWQTTGPWGSITGFGLGFVMAMVRIIRATQRQEREEAAKKKAAAGK